MLGLDLDEITEVRVWPVITTLTLGVLCELTSFCGITFLLVSASRFRDYSHDG
jgi:hypothetical protein